jgi:hypothetical protein
MTATPAHLLPFPVAFGDPEKGNLFRGHPESEKDMKMVPPSPSRPISQLHPQ